MILRSFFLFILGTVLLAACAARADADQVIEPVVIPGVIDGHHRGCDLSFHLARGLTGNNFDSAIGATLSIYATGEYRWVGALKMGFQPRPGVVLPPSRAFLVVGDRTNESEVTEFEPSESRGYMRINFAGDEVTAAAFDALANTGNATIRVQMPNSEPSDWS